MHTPDPSDEELDALFRQGAERYPEELNLGAWARMEQKLDEAHVQQLVNRKVARLFAAEIGIVAVLLLLWGGYRELQPQPVAGAPAGTVAAESAAASSAPANVAPAARGHAPARAGSVAGVAVASAAANAPASAAPSAASAAPGGVDAAATPAGPTARTARGHHGRALTPAVAFAAAEVPGASPETGELASEAGGQTHSRRRRQPAANASQLAALLAGPNRKARAGREASRPTAAPATRAQAPNSEASTASAARPTPTDSPSGSNEAAARALNAQAVTASPASGSSGAAQQQAEAAAAVQQTAAPVAAAETKTEAQALTAEMLLPRQAALQTLPGEALPELLPADSVVRRRPRPFTPSRIFITGLYAPELSTVRNAGFDKPGYSAGLQVEYLLRPRLRLSVGLLSSLKHYQARGSDYTWYRPPMYPVDRVEGTCRITDVPVNLRFDAWQGVRQRAFVSAGLSSLLMRDEQYYYSYNYYGTPTTRSWQVKKGSRHLFSVVNLSAGAERQLSLRWSVQAEPYVKVPLGGVGAGKVRLSSGGVFFGLKYGL